MCRVAHDRRRRRPKLGAEADRIGLQREQLRRPRPRISYLYSAPSTSRRNESLPYAGVGSLAHRVAAAVPAIEVAHDRDARRIRRPDREMHARHAVAPHRVRAELVVQTRVRNFAERRRGRRPCCSAHRGLGARSQISSAYSRIARSDENQPTRAVLTIALRHQSAGTRHRSSTAACAVRYPSKSAATMK